VTVLDAGVQKLFSKVLQLSFLNDGSMRTIGASIVVDGRTGLQVDLLLHEKLDVRYVSDGTIFPFRIDLQNLKVVNQRMAHDRFISHNFLNLKLNNF
jgi:hypothetical protein